MKLKLVEHLELNEFIENKFTQSYDRDLLIDRILDQIESDVKSAGYKVKVEKSGKAKGFYILPPNDYLAQIKLIQKEEQVDDSKVVFDVKVNNCLDNAVDLPEDLNTIDFENNSFDQNKWASIISYIKKNTLVNLTDLKENLKLNEDNVFHKLGSAIGKAFEKGNAAKEHHLENKAIRKENKELKNAAKELSAKSDKLKLDYLVEDGSVTLNLLASKGTSFIVGAKIEFIKSQIAVTDILTALDQNNNPMSVYKFLKLISNKLNISFNIKAEDAAKSGSDSDEVENIKNIEKDFGLKLLHSFNPAMQKALSEAITKKIITEDPDEDSVDDEDASIEPKAQTKPEKDLTKQNIKNALEKITKVDEKYNLVKYILYNKACKIKQGNITENNIESGINNINQAIIKSLYNELVQHQDIDINPIFQYVIKSLARKGKLSDLQFLAVYKYDSIQKLVNSKAADSILYDPNFSKLLLDEYDFSSYCSSILSILENVKQNKIVKLNPTQYQKLIETYDFSENDFTEDGDIYKFAFKNNWLHIIKKDATSYRNLDDLEGILKLLNSYKSQNATLNRENAKSDDNIEKDIDKGNLKSLLYKLANAKEEDLVKAGENLKQDTNSLEALKKLVKLLPKTADVTDEEDDEE